MLKEKSGVEKYDKVSTIHAVKDSNQVLSKQVMLISHEFRLENTTTTKQLKRQLAPFLMKKAIKVAEDT